MASTLLAAALAVAGCDVDAPSLNSSSRGFNRPVLQVGAVTATTSYTADGRPVRSALTPDGLTTGVAVSASLRIHFDRFLLPHKVIRQSICLRPVLDEVNSIDDCSDPFQPFAEPHYDPVTRTVTYRLLEGTELDAQTTYRLTIFVRATRTTPASSPGTAPR